MDQAINAGLALSCYARLAIHGMLERGVSPGTFLAIQRLLEHTVIDLCRGQYLDLDFRNRAPMLDDYLEMVRLKTGVLLGTACEIGALVAGAKEKRTPARKFGEALGIGFQLRDDYLGAWGNPQEMGKAADDLKDRMWGLPFMVEAQMEGPAAAAIREMIHQWTLQAESNLSEVQLPAQWHALLLNLTRALASRTA